MEVNVVRFESFRQFHFRMKMVNRDGTENEKINIVIIKKEKKSTDNN